MSGPVETARAAWGPDIPSWVLVLARECEASSQNKVAARIRRSSSLVSAVLRAKYKGDIGAVEDLVRGVFEKARVQCPQLGQIATNVCRDWQLKGRSFSNVNSERVRMYRACKICPHRRKEGV
ncbi:MAG: hypothetical protein EP320_00640 [Rhodobacteraceae bacterium]|nr:hypothetical protein [Stutzerimonas balearica]TNF16802.1 MAG: hypothetical protein EP320_00640 [Paracoccaceae bacterium]